MKHFLLSLSLFFVCSNVCGQIESKYVPEGTALKEAFKLKENPAIQTKVKVLPLIGRKEFITDSPECIGKHLHTSYSLEDGEWINVEGGRIWSLSFLSKDATSLCLILSDLYLPDGSAICITNKQGNYLMGPITWENVKNKDYLATDFIPGREATLYAFEPSTCLGQVSISVKDVVSSIVPTELDSLQKGLSSSGNCYVDVACYDDFAYKTQSDAICRFSISDGSSIDAGTGCLIRTTDNSFPPYILTAYHVIDMNDNDIVEQWEIDALQNSTFVFKYKQPVCGGNLSSPYVINNYVTGASFLAGWKDTDFALLRLNLSESEQQYFRQSMYWLGWDRNSSAPQCGICLHHPEGGDMKISIDDDQLQTYSLDGYSGFWKSIWDEGVIFNGSSGAPVIDNHNRVRGQLKSSVNGSKTDPCANTQSIFGKFNLSWEGGGTSTTRLKDWLNPSNYNFTNVDGRQYYVMMGLDVVCDSAIYSIDNIESNMNVNWSLSDSYYSSRPNLFKKNYPTPGKCMIKREVNHPLNGILTATVTQFNGTSWNQIVQLEKTVKGDDFYCTVGTTGSSMIFPLPAYLTSGMMMNVPYDGVIILDSQDFRYMSISTSGSFTYYDNDQFNGKIYFSVARGAQFTIMGHSTNSCKQFSLTFIGSDHPHVWPPIEDFTIQSLGGGVFTAKLVVNEEEAKKTMSRWQINLEDYLDDWTMEVYSIETNRRMTCQKAKGASCTFNTSGWQSGVYVVTATLGSGETFSKKFKL